MTRRLVLLRHGRTAWNAVGRAQGVQDVGLDDEGRAQAAVVAPYVAAMGPAALWTSDLLRARETCRYVEEATGLSATVDGRLREFDVGERQGMTPDEFAAAFPEAHAEWMRGDEMVRVPGSEVASEVAQRMVPALHEVLGTLGDGETGVVVTHGACLKVGLVALLGWPLSQTVAMRGIDNCAWVTLTERAGDVRLESYHRRAQDNASETVDL